MSDKRKPVQQWTAVLIFALLMSQAGCHSDQGSEQTTVDREATVSATPVNATEPSTTTTSGAFAFPFPAPDFKALGEFGLTYFQGMPETRSGTLSPAQAQAFIGEEQLSIMEIMVPDLYEKTGAQLFYVMSRENAENNQLRQYIVLGNQVYWLETIYKSYQVFDIDQDGQAELLAIIPGWTSGLFSFGIEVVDFNNGILHYQCKQYIILDYYSRLVLQADASAAYVYAAEFEGTQLLPTAALYQLTISEGELVFVDLRESK